VRLGSFAKTLAPGLRLGWLTGPGELLRRMAAGGLLDSGGGINHFTAMAVAMLCKSGDFDTQVGALRAAYAERREALVTALREHLPGCRVRRPAGGFFVWVELPKDGPAASELTERAEAGGVGYLPGERFHLDGGGRHCLRLAFSLYGPEALQEGAKRLGRVIGQ
jgi:DNA-binding transcriptional MocR family regulator